MSTATHLFMRSAAQVFGSERDEAKDIREAYMLVHCLGNEPFIPMEGFLFSLRVQAYLCKRYTEIALKGWPKQ
jgi:hypothetical protein